MNVLGLGITDAPRLSCDGRINRKSINVACERNALDNRAVARAFGLEKPTRNRKSRKGQFNKLANIGVATVINDLGVQMLEHAGPPKNGRPGCTHLDILMLDNLDGIDARRFLNPPGRYLASMPGVDSIAI